MLQSHRPWITPLVAGAFLISAVTGVLMFFHLDSRLNKLAHEWLSWALLAGAVLHGSLHWASLKRYTKQRMGQVVLLVFGVLLAASFSPLTPSGGGEPPFGRPVRALAQAPLAEVASIYGLAPDELLQRLRQARPDAMAAAEQAHGGNHQTTIAELAGPDLKAQLQLLNRVTAAR